MSNFITDAIGSFAGSIEYAFGGGAALQSQSDSLDAQLNALNQADYSPGGSIYNSIAAVNGTAAADAALKQVQDNAASSAANGTVKDQLQTAGKEGAAQGSQQPGCRHSKLYKRSLQHAHQARALAGVAGAGDRCVPLFRRVEMAEKILA